MTHTQTNSCINNLHKIIANKERHETVSYQQHWGLQKMKLKKERNPALSALGLSQTDLHPHPTEPLSLSTLKIMKGFIIVIVDKYF